MVFISLKSGWRKHIFSLFCCTEIGYIRQIRLPSFGNCKLPLDEQVGSRIMASSLVVSLRSICIYIVRVYFYVRKSYANVVNSKTKPLNETISLICKIALVTLISSLCYGNYHLQYRFNVAYLYNVFAI